VFPLSYGGFDSGKGNDMISYGISYCADDLNILISGKSSSITHDDGLNNDGFIMKVTPLGFYQWISYLSTKQGQDEYVGMAVAQQGFVYGHFHSNNPTATARTSAIVKLSFDEGKLLWAKTIMFLDNIYQPPSVIYRDSGYMIGADPTDGSRIIVGSLLSFFNS
jgi:hypothetical protein